MSATSKANYQISFPQGPLVDKSGLITGEWQKFFIWLFNRTGSGIGIDGLYLANQGDTNSDNISDIQSEIKEMSTELLQNTIRAEQLNTQIKTSIEKMESLFLVSQLNINKTEDNSEFLIILSMLQKQIREEYENLFIMLTNNQSTNNLSSNLSEFEQKQDSINTTLSNGISSLTDTVNDNKTEQDNINNTVSQDISDLHNLSAVNSNLDSKINNMLQQIEDYSIINLMS